MHRNSPSGLPPEGGRARVTVETVVVREPGRIAHEEPFRVRWEDGRRWEIERIYGHEAVGTEDGGDIVRWRVLIGGAPKYIYDGPMGWFVVPKAPPRRLP